MDSNLRALSPSQRKKASITDQLDTMTNQIYVKQNQAYELSPLGKPRNNLQSFTDPLMDSELELQKPTPLLDLEQLGILRTKRQDSIQGFKSQMPSNGTFLDSNFDFDQKQTQYDMMGSINGVQLLQQSSISQKQNFGNFGNLTESQNNFGMYETPQILDKVNQDAPIQFSGDLDPALSNRNSIGNQSKPFVSGSGSPPIGSIAGINTVQSFSPKLKNKSDMAVDQMQQHVQVYSTYEESHEDDSLANPTKCKSITCDRDSLSEEEDMVYVPFEYQGDGRKREAKRHKSQVLVAQDEIALDQMIKEYQNHNEKIIEIEQELENLKTLNISKRELQSKRNRLTAQLSRDRQKLEMTFLKAMAVNYQRLLRRLDKKLNTGGSDSNSSSNQSVFCSSCHQKLNNTLMHHKNNLAIPQQFKDSSEKSQSVKERPNITEYGLNTEPQLKKKKVENILSDSDSTDKSQKTKSKISDRRKGKGKAKIQQTKSRLGQVATAVGMFGVLGYVDKVFQIGGGESMGSCETGLVEANHTTYQPVREDSYEERIGDISIDDHGSPFGWYQSETEILLNDYDRQRILELAQMIKSSSGLVPASSGFPVNRDLGRNISSYGDSNQFSLEDTYLAYDLRESYLQRQSNPFGNQAESTILETDEFSTKTCNLWRAPSNSPQFHDEDQIFQSHQQRYENLEVQTQSLYCPAGSMISALKQEDKQENGGAIVRSDQAFAQGGKSANPSDQPLLIDINENSGDQYLHLVLPTDKINFLNGIDAESVLGIDEDDRCNKKGSSSGEDNNYDETLFEVSCKIQEVNKVYYKQPQIANTIGLLI